MKTLGILLSFHQSSNSISVLKKASDWMKFRKIYRRRALIWERQRVVKISKAFRIYKDNFFIMFTGILKKRPDFIPGLTIERKTNIFWPISCEKNTTATYMFALSFFAGFWIYLHVRLHRRCCCLFPEENWNNVNQRPHFDELCSPASLFKIFW